MTWIDDFLSRGPEYAAEDMPVAGVQDLLFRAGVGAGLPSHQAQDMAGMAALLMSDPKLFSMAVAALEGPHLPVKYEGTADHIVIENARIAMAATKMTDAFANGALRVVLHGLDWPQLLWPVLVRAQQVYGFGAEFSRPDAHTVMVSRSKTTLPPLGDPQAVPTAALTRLHQLAAKTSPSPIG